MLGRGTRLCPDLFGPGQDKAFFGLFDFCQNLEFFSQNPETTDGAAGESLGKRLFKYRLELIDVLDHKLGPVTEDAVGEVAEVYADPRNERELRTSLADLLRTEVAAMNFDNFVVRPHRRMVEKFSQADAWQSLAPDEFRELLRNVAGLPSELEAEGEEAKRFDLLLLNLQLAVLRAEPAFERLCEQVKGIAGLLEEKSSIPLVRDQLPLIQDLQSEEWWQNVTTPMLEIVRRRLRLLVRLIEKHKRKPIFTNFEDDLGTATEVGLPGFAPADQWEKFRAKVRAFLLSHQDHAAVQKLRTNQPLSADDLADLERVLMESGAEAEQISRAREEAAGLGLFVRSLVGLDREAAKNAFSQFLTATTLSGSQIEFLNMIIDHLADHGLMDPEKLYASPFTDVTPLGPEGLFGSEQVDRLIEILAQVRSTAIATAV